MKAFSNQPIKMKRTKRHFAENYSFDIGGWNNMQKMEYPFIAKTRNIRFED